MLAVVVGRQLERLGFDRRSNAFGKAISAAFEPELGEDRLEILRHRQARDDVLPRIAQRRLPCKPAKQCEPGFVRNTINRHTGSAQALETFAEEV